VSVGVWNLVHGGTHDWRADRCVLRAHDVAALAAAAVSGARFGVQQWLYVSDETGWLGVARVAMGWPLTILAERSRVGRGNAEPDASWRRVVRP
jgi:hypothetical protein